MKRHLQTTLILVLIICSNLHSQDTIYVIEGDTTTMYYNSKLGDWLFKEGIKDGYYISLNESNQKYKTNEIKILNGKKHGIESRYFFKDAEKYAEIEWENGEIHGKETYFNGNGTINYVLTYRNDNLNGYCEYNWTEGEKNYNGFFKDNLPDSLWTYWTYDYDEETNTEDETGYKSKIYQFSKGRKYLLSAWDKNGKQIITNGNGLLKENGYYRTITEYRNRLKNGKQQFFRDDLLEKENFFVDDLLITQVIYSKGKIKSKSSWQYSKNPQIDTVNYYDEDFEVHCKQIIYKFDRWRNENWEEYYDNGQLFFSGNYLNDKRIGNWQWYYKNGKTRIKANFDDNIWEHYDTAENEISNLANEYLTLLTEKSWFLNTGLNEESITFTQENEKVVTPRFIFHYDDTLNINSFLECGKDIEFSLNKYSIMGDELNIFILGKEDEIVTTYRFKIISGNDDEIILKNIK